MGCISSKPKDNSSSSANSASGAKNAESNSDNNNNSSNSSSDFGNSSFLVDSKSLAKGRIDDVYEIGAELGRGTFSVVKEGINKKNKQLRVALKFIDKKFIDKDDVVLLRREIEIMKKVQHENVLSLKEIYETETNLTLVMELVTGGELFFKIVEQGSYSEKDASNIVRQIVNGVKYLHSQGIAHRDLKPENLLCSFHDHNGNPVGGGSSSSNMSIKIADFGLSKIFAGGQQLETSCGTPDYAAPEVLTGEQAYDKSVDLWSVGVITYVLLCGYPPFYASSQPALFEKIIHADYDFPEPEWSYISDTARDFIKNLLVLDPSKRMTVEECMAHPFLAGSAGTHMLNIEKSMTRYNVERKKAKQTQEER